MKKSGRVSNPELTKMGSEQKRLLRHGRNSIGVANTGATSGAALLTEAQTGSRTRKQSIQNFSTGMDAESVSQVPLSA